MGSVRRVCCAAQKIHADLFWTEIVDWIVSVLEHNDGVAGIDNGGCREFHAHVFSRRRKRHWIAWSAFELGPAPGVTRIHWGVLVWMEDRSRDSM